MTYESFFAALKKVSEPEIRQNLQEIPITVERAVTEQVPLPFPALAQETELCSNEKSKRELGMVYTDFAEGIDRTYRAFRNVFIQ